MRQFDAFLDGFFQKPYDLEITACLTDESFPPHLRFRIAPRDKPWHYDMLMALDTLQAIGLFVVLHESSNSLTQIPVSLEGERASEGMWIKTVP